jgi:predicted aspartyl protease
MVFVTFNTSCGKPKPVTIQALLDSGAFGSLTHKKFVRKLKLKMSKSSTKWTTTAGDLTTNSKCKSQFCIPELEDKILLEYDLNVTNTLVGYNMIIGCNILEVLGIVIDFKQKIIIWDH